jgi:hypothetical protein
MEKVAESDPDSVHVTDSFAEKVKTDVLFSVMEIELVAPVEEPGPVMTGAKSATNLTITTPEPPAPPSALLGRP